MSGIKTPGRHDFILWRWVLFAKSFQFNSVHSAQETTIKLAELVCYSDQYSDLRRMTDFVRRDDKTFDMSVLVKHDMGKRAYYTSTIVTGTIENCPDGETIIRGSARFGAVYLATVLGISLFCIGMVVGTLAEPIVAGLWGLLLLFMGLHIRQMFLDRNQIIHAINEKCQQPLLSQAERETSIGEWQSISRYAEGNFYNTQAQ
jgi:hypothetical protein